MVQFYFLSILFNGLAGYYLISGDEEGLSESRSKLSLLPLKDETFKLILGILTLIAALFKVIFPMEKVWIIGDLFPAVAGFAAGFILVYEYYKGRAAVEEESSGASFVSFLLRNKKIFGFVALAAAALHFLVPSALIL